MIDLFLAGKTNIIVFIIALESLPKRIVKCGTETISYGEPQIWNQILERLKAFAALNKFKKEIKIRV